MITALATRYLERRGHVLIPPGTGRAVIKGFVVYDAGMDLKVVPLDATILRDGERAVPSSSRVIPEGYVAYETPHQAEQAALASLRSRKWKLFPPPSMPVVGTRWEPSRGEFADREVLECEEDGLVRYRNLVTGEVHTVTLRTWAGWGTEARARCV